MKRSIFTIIALIITLSVISQDLNVKAMLLYKSDGSQDTVIWKNVWSYSDRTVFYGKENPQDDDYINFSFAVSDTYQVTYACSLTPSGQKAPYSSFGMMLSSSHINDIPEMQINWEKDMYRGLYFVDKGEWLWPTSVFPEEGNIIESCQMDYEYVKEHLALIPGQTYYARAYYILDGNIYYSSEVETLVPKALRTMFDIVYPDYCAINDTIIFSFDAAAIINNNADLFGDNSGYRQRLLKEYVRKVLIMKGITNFLSLATKIERCVDGNLYVIDDIPSAIVDDALQFINNELLETYYLQAIPDNVFWGAGTTTEFGTRKCLLTMLCEVDEKWGIRDNQYLCTLLDGTTAKPQIAFMLNHLMRPGETYNVKLTLAPNTFDESDTRNTDFQVYIASLKDDGSIPTIQEAQLFGDDTLTVGVPIFVVKPHELKTITIPYKATSFTDQHFLQLMHVHTFTSSANRAKYGQIFRIVGIEVEPKGR